MTPTIDTYCGSPIEISSEKEFLGKLTADLRAGGHAALILANFFPQIKPLQIDFLIVTELCACHVELKKISAPLVGGLNGPWYLKQPNGSQISLADKNPYRQALDGKFALSDEMHNFVRQHPDVPAAPGGDKFYKHFDSVVCIFPELRLGSSVPSDYRVRVKGYADLLQFITANRAKPVWSLQHWREFAMHLHLVRDVTDDPTPPEFQAACHAVREYAHRFDEFYGNKLPRLVSTDWRDTQGKVKSTDIEGWLLQNGHLQLLGPTGCGKSMLAKKMAITACHDGRLTMWVPAKEYDGKLSVLLNRSVAHLHPHTAHHLLEAACRAGSPLALVIDGFNECPRSRQAALVKDLHAFYLRWPCPIVLTAQEPVQLTGPLAGDLFHFEPLTPEQRIDILQSYLGADWTESAQARCEPFATPYEISLVAQCLSEVGVETSRAALFDAYVRRCCEKTEYNSVARSALTAIAEQMSKRLTSSISTAEGWRVVRRRIVREDTSVLDRALALARELIEMRQCKWTFRHELLERFFRAEALVQAFGDSQQLAQELARPRNRCLAEFVIGGETDPEVVRKCLESLADARIMAECFAGQWGEIARDVVRAQCTQQLKAAEQSLEDVDVELAGVEGLRHLEIVHGQDWSRYQLALMQVIGEAVNDGVFVEDVLRLVRRTEEACIFSLMAKGSGDETLSVADSNSLFASLFVFMSTSGRRVFPAAVAYNAMRLCLRRPHSTAVKAWVAGLAERVSGMSVGELAFVCQVWRKTECDTLLFLPEMLHRCWNSRIYHLRLDGLELAEWHAGQLSGRDRNTIVSYLSSLQSNNGLLSTAIIDALNAYGEIESPVSAVAAVEEVLAIVQGDECAQTCAQAYNAVCCVFEDIFQNVYWEAIETLQPDHRIKLFARAAIGMPNYSMMHTDWILTQLIRSNNLLALPAFRHWASFINVECMSSHDAAACFALAVKGWAAFQESPLPLVAPNTDNGHAWEAYGAILFWLAKPGLSAEDRQAVCKPWWDMLVLELPFEAVDPLYHLSWVNRAMSPGENYNPMAALASFFPEEIRRILEFGFHHADELTTIFSGRWHLQELRSFIIMELGFVGNRATAKLLERLIDSPEFGRLAVGAIQKLQTHGK